MSGMYVMSRTGLFHRLAEPGTTACGMSTDEPGLVPTSSEQADWWLMDNPHDLCRRCREMESEPPC